MTADPEPQSDDALLHDLQHAAFSWFRARVSPVNGLVPDTSRPGSPVSIAGVGFALSAWPIGVARGWMTRADALAHSLAAVRFFRDAEQSERPEATGHRGFFYHFLDPVSGARVWRCELSMIDTALLIAGALTAAAWFDADTPDEQELRDIVDQLYRRIDWEWARNGGQTLRQGWKPESGFLNYGWEGYSEAILLYVLALGSPTHPIGVEAYEGWTATYQWENLYDQDLLYGGPLFVHQFSHAWIDLRGIRDPFMREKGSDYFENSRRATRLQSEYAWRNPNGFTGYGVHCWGFSAGDGPTDENPEVTGEERRQFGYAARGVPYGPDDGTLSTWTVVSSVPFAPELCLATLRHVLAHHPQTLRDGCFVSGFNPTAGWVSDGTYALDQGIVLLMLENARSGTIWRLLRSCAPIRDGLRRAGFDGGWL